MSGLHFDWSIGIGHILTAISVTVSLAWFLSRNIAKYVQSVDRLSTDVGDLSAQVKQLRDLRAAFNAVEKTNADQTKEIARFSGEMRTVDTRGQILERTVDRIEKRLASLDKEVLRARENIHTLRNNVMMVFAKDSSIRTEKLLAEKEGLQN